MESNLEVLTSAKTENEQDDKKVQCPDSSPVKAPSQSSIIMKLIFHSMAMFSLPFVAYYFTKQYVEDEYDIPPPRSYVYGAIAAVILVHVVIVSYVYQAFQEEDRFRKAKEFEDKNK